MVTLITLVPTYRFPSLNLAIAPRLAGYLLGPWMFPLICIFKDLCDTGPLKISIQDGASRQSPYFNASMCFIKGFDGVKSFTPVVVFCLKALICGMKGFSLGRRLK